MTRYEQAKARLAELEQERAKVEGELAEAEEKAAQALLRGERPGTIDAELGQRLRVLDRAIALARKEVADLEREDLKRRLGEIEKEKQKLANELGKAREVYEAAKREFQKAEQRFGAVHLRITQATDRLHQEEFEIRAKLEAPGAEEARKSEPVDPEAVEAILARFRAGAITTYVAGQDPATDEAYRLYQREAREIQAWARKDALSRTTTGERIAPPECVAHYTKERLEEIIKKAQAKGGVGTMEKPGTGLLLEQRTVPI